MAAQHVWRGAERHGFSGPAALKYAWDHAGSRFKDADEICAKLMNGILYADPHPPQDSEDREDFADLIVSDEIYQWLVHNAEAHGLAGWCYYLNEDPTSRTLERPIRSLIVSDGTELQAYEISRNSHRLRRRVVLPIHLRYEGEPLYHYLQYKKLPNISGGRRADILSGLEHENELEEEILNARAAFFAGIAAGVGHDMEPEEWEQYLADFAAGAAGGAGADAGDEAVYHSSSDSDYNPDDDEEDDDDYNDDDTD